MNHPTTKPSQQITNELVAAEVCLEPEVLTGFVEAIQQVRHTHPPHTMTWNELLDKADTMYENRESHTFSSLANYFGSELEELSLESQQERLHAFTSLLHDDEKYTAAAFHSLQDQSLPITELSSCVLSAIYDASSSLESKISWEKKTSKKDLKRTSCSKSRSNNSCRSKKIYKSSIY